MKAKNCKRYAFPDNLKAKKCARLQQIKEGYQIASSQLCDCHCVIKVMPTRTLPKLRLRKTSGMVLIGALEAFSFNSHLHSAMHLYNDAFDEHTKNWGTYPPLQKQRQQTQKNTKKIVQRLLIPRQRTESLPDYSCPSVSALSASKWQIDLRYLGGTSSKHCPCQREIKRFKIENSILIICKILADNQNLVP